MTSAPFSQKRELGQHFLVDENILAVIERMAQLDTRDVVLEVGPGLGVLTIFLADRVARVHAVEVDETLEPYLRERLEGRGNVELTFADALRAPLGELDPSPTKLVANLPYSIATPLVVESLTGLPTVGLWCVLVQREIAERFFAEPGTKAYGAVSVLVQLATERTAYHPVARTCFRPPPNVDSALVAFRRRAPAAPGVVATAEIVHAAFAHRRKTLANSLELTGVAGRAQAAAALRELGRAADVRAEALEPEEFLRLAELIG